MSACGCVEYVDDGNCDNSMEDGADCGNSMEDGAEEEDGEDDDGDDTTNYLLSSWIDEYHPHEDGWDHYSLILVAVFAAADVVDNADAFAEKVWMMHHHVDDSAMKEAYYS